MAPATFPDPDGVAWIEGFDRAIAVLDTVDAKNRRQRVGALADALEAVFAVALLRDVDASASWAQRGPAFFEHVRIVLDRYRPLLAVYLARLEHYLWQRNPSGWREACMRRSAVQVLRDNVEANAQHPLIEPGRLGEIDDDFREIAAEVAPLDADDLPRYIPDGHWWWRLPSGLASDEDSYSY